MTTDEQCLRIACMADPNDDAPWCAYEDWLREHGRDDKAVGLFDTRALMQARPGLSMEMAEDVAAVSEFGHHHFMLKPTTLQFTYFPDPAKYA